MENFLYKDIKNEKHIFIYSVCGRTSSTAFQRILNSSNQVCIFGETENIVDDILELIENLSQKNWGFKDVDLSVLIKCFNKNKHDRFYPNAIRNVDIITALLNNIFTEFFRPVIEVKRFGFKEINIKNIRTLNVLNKLFKNGKFIFTFRDPIKQWISVNQTGYFSYSKDVNLFLAEYKRMSDIYLNFKDNNSFYFAENDILYDVMKVIKLFKVLDISKFDESLIGMEVITLYEQEKNNYLKESYYIKDSDAYRNYEEMSKLSNEFFQ